MSLKLTYSRDAFVESLNAISKVVSTNENKIFWIIVKDEVMTFVATDEKNFIKATPMDKAQCDADVNLCLPFVEFYTFITNANHENVSISIDDNFIICSFKGEKGKYKFSRYDIDLPEIPKIESDNEISLNSIEFIEALNKTAFSVHPAKNRAPITSVKMDIYDDHFEASSTDTGRISKFTKKYIEKKDIKNITIFLPKQSIDIIKTLPFGAEVEIMCNNHLVSISSGDNFVFVGPQEASGEKFPDLSVFFSGKEYASLSVSYDDILGKLNLADALTRGEDKINKRLILMIDDMDLNMKITGSKTAMEDNIKCSDVEILNDKIDLKVVFPMYRLLEAIKACTMGSIILKLVAPPDGINSVDIFMMVETDNWKHLILTMVNNDV